jgi:hypothetical protein
MVGVPGAHVASINRPTPQAMIIVLAVILTEITGNWEINEFGPETLRLSGLAGIHFD